MTRVLLGSSDPVFSLLCRRALAGTRLELLAVVPPARLVEATRQGAPERSFQNKPLSTFR